MKFIDIDFTEPLHEGIEAMGYKECTPIQEKAIPVIQERKDLIACAQTGTGKTAAFLLPILDRISQCPDDSKIRALIIVPTRELALQIDQQIEGMSYYSNVSSIPVYGGSESDMWSRQKQALSSGADIVVATPGRLLQHLGFNYVDLKEIDVVILDEADRMLDMGFYEDIVKIMSETPDSRQTLLFSATMPSKIRKLANTILNDPEEVNIAISKPAEKILQVAYMVYDKNKVALIQSLLEGKDYLNGAIIFCSRKSDVNELSRALNKLNLHSAAIHSDLDQKERENALLDFRSHKIQLLVATDILARGIDIKDLDLVINYNVPNDAADYVHRVGRTARADASGIAITLISDKDQSEFKDIEVLIEREILKLNTPPEIGDSPVYAPNSKRHHGFNKKRRFYKKKK
ncbi:DEAD/DEAH box helicase [Halosquirtibacter xylanolyticus]|uniref:DEAD/DEAH box helicase n=1 Tax=Halosquirtibacter xylanolyticus TaxID=3374599 RepID=UPI00374A37E4|nr:DEAD/DEAH box helicase [Prolixibacteraceae bacterium]